jgi:uncharacterized protein YcfJ
MKKTVLALLIAPSVVFAQNALTPNNQLQFHDIAKVVNVEPVFSMQNVPSQSCRQVSVVVPSNDGTTGTIIGGVAGGIIGNQVGAGVGKGMATAIGAVTGAVVGSKIDKSMSQQSQVQTQCFTTYQTVSSPEGYNTTLDYRGRQLTIRTNHPPQIGSTLSVNVYVSPQN